MGFNPSGALIKAVLVHSAQPIQGVVNDYWGYGELGGWPSYDQGYGRVQLDAVLTFPSSSDNSATSASGSGSGSSSGFYCIGAASADSDGSYFSKKGQSFTFSFRTPEGESGHDTSASSSSSRSSSSSNSNSMAPIGATLAYTDAVSASGSDSVMVNALTLRAYARIHGASGGSDG